jgi:hypothetical protein
MVDLVELQSVVYLAEIIGVAGTLTAAFIGVRSYINSNKRAEEARKRELETRQAQLFMQVFERYRDPEFWNGYTEMMNKEWKSYDEWNRDRMDPSIAPARLAIGTYFEGIGTLIHRGLLQSDLVADILGGVVVMWWNKQGEFMKEFRVKAGYPHYGEYVEYLYNEMMKLRPAGFSPSWKGMKSP